MAGKSQEKLDEPTIRRIRDLKALGKPYAEITAETGVAKSTIGYHVGKGDYAKGGSKRHPASTISVPDPEHPDWQPQVFMMNPEELAQLTGPARDKMVAAQIAGEG